MTLRRIFEHKKTAERRSFSYVLGRNGPCSMSYGREKVGIPSTDMNRFTVQDSTGIIIKKFKNEIKNIFKRKRSSVGSVNYFV